MPTRNNRDELRRDAADAVKEELTKGPPEPIESTGDSEVTGEVIQDNKRETALVQLFGLTKPQGAGRSGTDATLEVNGREVEFELKSATMDGITTARDVGPAHIRKWRTRHWLVGFFDKRGENLLKCLYASPELIKPWVDYIERYIKMDQELALLPKSLDHSLYEPVLDATIPRKDKYTLDDAKLIHKRQYTVAVYRDRMDMPGGYSRGRMLEIIADRWEYLTKRGATLNNPHIIATYYDNFTPVKFGSPAEAQASLREEVAKALEGE